ncbi:cationic amino acid transporter 7 [Actinidia rufa]|uniref:Cationic amino acid transporter 7 n=1 Tax=Actinidia rufa TaxID=165716 RepID=A0A7J0GVU0_9ERIC|nr:cationic amino acid transporter 7 [Actinidia rufa]
MVGARIFVTTGRVNRLYTGHAVSLSYAIVGLCALLSAFCYTEFAIDLPVAGGAFSYIHITFGEFAAFLTVSNLILDYVLSDAAVARSFTAYLGTAFGLSAATKWRVTISALPNGFNEIELVAVAVVLIITVGICYQGRIQYERELGVEHGVDSDPHSVHRVHDRNRVLQGRLEELHPTGQPESPGWVLPIRNFWRFQWCCDSVPQLHWVRRCFDHGGGGPKPGEGYPDWGIGISYSGDHCLLFDGRFHVLPYDMIDAEAPFAVAFCGGSNGWRWASNVVGVGASFGIVTSMLVAMLGQAQYMRVIGRSSVVPTWPNPFPTNPSDLASSANSKVLIRFEWGGQGD